MKGLFNRRIAWLLIALMLCALVPFTAYADTEVQPGDPDWVSDYWETLEAESNRSIAAPALGNAYAILYGDGTLALQSENTPEEGRAVTETYSVDLDGYDSAEAIPWYANRSAIKKVDIVSAIQPSSVAYWFMGCDNMAEFSGVENLNLSQATTMRDFFHGCASLKSLNLVVASSKRWDTSKVTDMSGLFYGCSSLKALDLSILSTSSLTNLENTFAGCTGLKKMSMTRWNVSKVTNMKGLFKGCSGLTEVDLSGWDTSHVTDMSEMFSQCGKLATIKAGASFVTSQVTSSADMFTGCSALKGGNGTAYSATYTDKDYARVDAGSAQPGYFSAGLFAILYADGTFAIQYGDTSDGREVKKTYPVNTSSAYAMSGKQIPNTPWFDDRESVTKVDFVDRISPEYAALWFYKMTNLEEVLHPENFDLSNCYQIMDLFYGCENLKKVDVSGWDTSKVTAAHGVFYSCGSLTELDVSGWNTSNMTDTSGMFFGCSNISELDIGGFDTGNVTTFSSMFRGCTKLTHLDVGHWNTSSIQQLGGVFEDCIGLTELDLSSWDTANCFYYGDMFRGATNLRVIWASDKFTLYVEGIEENYVKRGVNVFTDCPALVGGNGMTYDPERVDYHYLVIDSADAPGYLSRKALRLSDELPLTQAGSPVDRSALSGLSALNVKLDCANPESTEAIFVAAFYDASGMMLNAFLTRVTVQPDARTVAIPVSGVSGSATRLQLFALNPQFTPITASMRFQLN